MESTAQAAAAYRSQKAKETEQQDRADRVERHAKKLADLRERKQKLRNDPAFRELEKQADRDRYAARAQNPAFLELRVSNSFYSPCLFNVFLFCRTRQNVTVTLNVHKTLLFLSFGYPTRSILPVCSTCVSFAEQGRTGQSRFETRVFRQAAL
jgi:hypothetical protein